MAELGLVDVNSSSQEIESQITAINAYIDTLKAEKKLRKDKTNPYAREAELRAAQLNKIALQQKRYQRNVPTSMDQLTKLLGLTSGNGSESKKYIRNIILTSAIQAENEVKTIIQEESLKALGCSQEQTYTGVTAQAALNFDSLPVNNTIYVPLQSLDIITLANGLLKTDYQSPVGQILYEHFPVLTTEGIYKPFGGKVPFPFNKLLSQLQKSNNSFNQQYSTYYRGSSGQNLFDIKYVTTNEFGVTGNYYRIALINRDANINKTDNKIGQFLSDYYSTIKLYDTTELGAQIMNFISQFLNMQVPATAGPISNQSKFAKILQRILGLCFDNKTEIDVSGVSKIAELDGIDDSFYEFTEIDLREIDLNIQNVQNGVMEFQDCENVKLPVDYENITSQFIDLKNNMSGQTTEQQVAGLEKIIDSLSSNPNWKIYLPASFNANAAISNNIIQNIALAVASASLSPKVLLPIFIMLKITENSYNLSYNQAITPLTNINQLNAQASNIITNSVDFLKKFKSFAIQVISKIGAVFIKILFNQLKKELLNIITMIVSEIIAEQQKKHYKQSLALIDIGVQLAGQITKGIFDARKCKSLLDEIKNILSIVTKANSSGVFTKNPKKRQKLSLALAVLSDFLPGESPQRAFLNTTKYLQDIGLPTDALPDGTPNLMLLYNLATHKGRSDEQAQNGVNDTYCYQGFCWSVPR